MTVIDYTPFYYSSVLRMPVPPSVSGKFVQLGNAGARYLVFSPMDFTKYHANIIERFCMDKGIEGGYDAKHERFFIRDQAWRVLGGGKFERDGNNKSLKLSGDSLAYGKFDATGLKEMLAALPEFSVYDIIID